MQNIETIFCEVENATVLIAEIANSTRKLADDELQAVENAVPKRQKEFSAGREIALTALRNIGYQELSLPMSKRRFPVWPEGSVGSISHTSTMVGAAVAARRHYESIGFDIEIAEAVEPDLFSVILSESEKQAVNESPVADLATTIFGCKEAVFKAVNPITSENLDFLDIRITVMQRTFIAECIEDKKSASIIKSGVGYFESTDDLVTSLFLVT